jgi:hypothetical protein
MYTQDEGLVQTTVPEGLEEVDEVRIGSVKRVWAAIFV